MTEKERITHLEAEEAKERDEKAVMRMEMAERVAEAAIMSLASRLLVLWTGPTACLYAYHAMFLSDGRIVGYCLGFNRLKAVGNSTKNGFVFRAAFK